MKAINKIILCFYFHWIIFPWQSRTNEVFVKETTTDLLKMINIVQCTSDAEDTNRLNVRYH